MTEFVYYQKRPDRVRALRFYKDDTPWPSMVYGEPLHESEPPDTPGGPTPDALTQELSLVPYVKLRDGRQKCLCDGDWLVMFDDGSVEIFSNLNFNAAYREDL